MSKQLQGYGTQNLILYFQLMLLTVVENNDYYLSIVIKERKRDERENLKN